MTDPEDTTSTPSTGPSRPPLPPQLAGPQDRPAAPPRSTQGGGSPARPTAFRSAFDDPARMRKREPEYAGWGKRVGATFVDGLVLLPFVLILDAILGVNTIERDLLSAGLYGVYSTVLLGARGRTIGNMAAKTRVIKAEDHDEVIDYGQAFFRWVAQEFLAITVIFGILNLLWPLWDSKKQTLHDKAAGTLVVVV